MKPSCTGSSWPSRLEALDGAHRVAAGHGGQHRARLHRLAVDVDDAGAAVAGVTAPVGSGEPQLIPQEVHEQHAAARPRAVTCSPLTVMVTCMAQSPQRRSFVRARPRCAALGWSVRTRGGACSPRCRAYRSAGSAGCAAASARLGESLLGGRLADAAPPTTAASAVGVGVDRGQTDPGRRDRPVVECHRRAGRGHRPVADAALDLRVGARRAAAAPGSGSRSASRCAPSASRTGRPGSRPSGSPARPTGPRTRQTAPRTVQTVVRSSAGSAWHSEPPIVPRLRTTGSAITRSASRKIGHTAASSSDSSTCRCRAIAPIRTSVGSAPSTDVSQFGGQVVDVDEVFGIGEAQLHHRQQAVPARDDQRLRRPAGPEVRWRGPRPLRARIRMAQEPACDRPHIDGLCAQSRPVSSGPVNIELRDRLTRCVRRGGSGRRSRPASSPLPPHRRAMISAAIDTAVSSGVRRAQVEPDRAGSRASSVSVTPGLAQPGQPVVVGAARPHRADIADLGQPQRDLQQRNVELGVVGQHADDGAGVDLARRRAARPGSGAASRRRPRRRSGTGRAVAKTGAGVAHRDPVAEQRALPGQGGGEVDGPEHQHPRPRRIAGDEHLHARAAALTVRAVGEHLAAARGQQARGRRRRRRRRRASSRATRAAIPARRRAGGPPSRDRHAR